MPFDAARAQLHGPDDFPRFVVPDTGEVLRDLGLGEDVELVTVERGGARRAFLLKELAYHHFAQGKLSGEPYLVTF